MRYESGADFRRALESRLRQHALRSGMSLTRLRKMVAFERFLARLVTAQPDAWVLKGGLALQFRLRERARTTQDIDLLLRHRVSADDVHRALVAAALLDLDDWFVFEVARSTHPADLRFPVQGLLDGRLFEAFHVDVGMGDPLKDCKQERCVAPCRPPSKNVAPMPFLTRCRSPQRPGPEPFADCVNKPGWIIHLWMMLLRLWAVFSILC